MAIVEVSDLCKGYRDKKAVDVLSFDVEEANRVLTAGRAPVEQGFANLKNWRILTKLRTDLARAIHLLRALLVLTNLEAIAAK
jgi:hypothetical protein